MIRVYVYGLTLFSSLLLLLTGPVFAKMVTGLVAYTDGNLIVIVTEDGCTVGELYSGHYSLEKDDYVVGELHSYGFKDIFCPRTEREARVYVDNFWLSADRTVEWLQKKGARSRQPVRIVRYTPSPRPTTTGADARIINLARRANSVRLTDADLSGFSAKHLTLARNTIYALHGRVFSDPELRAFFNRQSWYYPKTNYHDGMLSAFERANAQFIMQYQKRTGKEW